MKLVSVTLTGNNEKIIGDALKSVINFVDYCVVIDTGVKDNSLEVAKEIAGDKLIIKNFPWINDFSAARNYSLKAAEEVGADWALILDTDERVVLNGEDIKEILSTTNSGCLIVNHCNDTYGKVRFIKVPSVTEFIGPTHEVFLSYKANPSTLKKCKFDELGKNLEQLKFKFERDVEILEKHVKKNPNDPRWFYYLGDSYKNLNRLDDAIVAYNNCWLLDGWDEESAWCMFRAAECYLSKNDYRGAIESLTKGMARHPGIPELSWLTGWCFYKQKIYDKAIIWSKISLTLGYPEGIAESVNRIGFRHPPGQWEGPYDVLHWSYCEMFQNNPSNNSYKELSDYYREKCVAVMNKRVNL